MKLSVIVPCYNEAQNLACLIARFDEVVNRDDIEVIIVNNGSTDGTEDVLRELARGRPFLRAASVKENLGYGFGILSGLREARGEFLAWTHADLQTDPADVITALEIIESRSGEPLFVKGRRKGRPALDSLFTIGMSVFETLLLGAALWDINAQPNMFHRGFYEKWENPPLDFSLDLYAFYTARKLGLTVERFPVVFSRRLHGRSKWNTGLASKWKFIKRTIDFSIRLKHDINYGIHTSQDKHN